MSQIIQQVTAEGFVSVITREDDGRVWFRADMDIDADGANGQNGAIAAYRNDNRGSEDLANGGMGIRNSRVIGVTTWFQDIVILDASGNPLVLPNGNLVSKTAYKFPGLADADPAAWVDSETVRYIVVPPSILGVPEVVKGCRARASFQGKSADCIVGDVGPRTKNGEGSIALARALDIKSSPRNGGVDGAEVLYELWPGQHGIINGKPIPLMRVAGTYVYPPNLPVVQPPAPEVTMVRTMELRFNGVQLQQLWVDGTGKVQQWRAIPTTTPQL